VLRAELVNNRFPVEGIRAVEKAMDRAGFDNPFLRVAVLSTVAKESGFVPKGEYSYKNTSNSRLKSLFSSLRDLSDTQLTALKKDDVAFYNKIYGGRYGNKDYGDAYKYRGRGFNQLTFRKSYEKYAKLSGHPIDKNPELLNRTDVASDVLVAFMENRFDSIPKNDSRFPVTDKNAFTDQATATRTVVNANHGWRRDVRQSHPKTLENAVKYSAIFNYPQALVEKFTEDGGSMVDSLRKNPKKFAKRNWIPLSIIAAGLGVGGYFLITKVIWKK
jgi:predicted chitinase